MFFDYFFFLLISHLSVTLSYVEYSTTDCSICRSRAHSQILTVSFFCFRRLQIAKLYSPKGYYDLAMAIRNVGISTPEIPILIPRRLHKRKNKS